MYSAIIPLYFRRFLKCGLPIFKKGDAWDVANEKHVRLTPTDKVSQIQTQLVGMFSCPDEPDFPIYFFEKSGQSVHVRWRGGFSRCEGNLIKFLFVLAKFEYLGHPGASSGELNSSSGITESRHYSDAGGPRLGAWAVSYLAVCQIIVDSWCCLGIAPNASSY